MKIISGGQNGVDRAALDFAIGHSIEHGGYCPRGRRAGDGPIPAKYNLIETTSRNYLARTELNVIWADATVIFKRATVHSPGSMQTEKFCRVNDKPYLMIGDYDEPHVDAGKLAAWLEKIKPTILNVAGHRETSCPGIHAYVYRVFTITRQLCEQLK